MTHQQHPHPYFPARPGPPFLHGARHPPPSGPSAGSKTLPLDIQLLTHPISHQKFGVDPILRAPLLFAETSPVCCPVSRTVPGTQGALHTALWNTSVHLLEQEGERRQQVGTGFSPDGHGLRTALCASPNSMARSPLTACPEGARLPRPQAHSRQQRAE